ncbi:lipopolysaccharide-induced tumor necrosis factor-alpha factor homolog isoform X2 [Mastacembelus armatus]|uniref:lipopolysaccharide-induced tumor necrosis factor-alpha factor homolog isoform X2 n=1 Tax=Mastacembelus armatus TaxID=205130 RepID=UPI000E45EF82|nr:lipopolysaccharide-induced tumor necrosis factor-alpha factor homolog isoform X2 [Mastacembelus armatus]XP_026159512.1 lipopolysaccharide-induced tumor necrosis factor-alpha factor homolog isoform X2 [Mastacembelus armatus]XP_026159513.1 lipopolysaccharide-induced tumor necrosis factor-alpha factor homolog isoform X2 [Mastacembelus armatus]
MWDPSLSLISSLVRYKVQQPAYQYSPQQPQVLQPGQQPVYNISSQQPAVIQPGQQPVYNISSQQPAVIQPVNPVIVVQQLPADAPGQMMCPHCQSNVVTTIKYNVGMLTWIICGVLGVLMCWPCCLIPFCVKDCKDVEHSCPTCHAVLHIHKRM